MKPQPPPHVRAAKLALRAASKAAREARARWYTWREEYAKRPDTISMIAVGSLTAAMWTAEQTLAIEAANWRCVLAEREALPVAERWDLAALERWAQKQGDNT